MTHRDRLVVLAALLVGAGCGGSSDAAPDTVDDFISRFYAALCNIQVSCGEMPDMPTCMASIQTDTTDILTLKADVTAGKVRYDKAKAGVCLETAERYYGSDCTRTAIAAASWTGTCGEAFVGTVPDGGACFQSLECASGKCKPTDAACRSTRQCCAGTCVAKPSPLPPGADCSASLPDQLCEAGSACIKTASSTTATCVVPSKVQGTACTVAYECASPLFCDLEPGTATGTCKPAATTGAACNSNVSVGACDDLRDICSKTSGKCTRRGSAGDACDPQQANSCLGDAQCIGSTCVPLSTARGACNPIDGPGCLGSLECSTQTNTCGFPASAGACL